MGSLAHIGPAIMTAFLASLVEAVEALTIVLAVGTVRGWRSAGLGAIAGLALLALIVAVLGPLLDRIPLHVLQGSAFIVRDALAAKVNTAVSRYRPFAR